MSAPASASSAQPAAAAAAATTPLASHANKEWSVADIPDIPEGADPLDYVNKEKLAQDNASLPTSKEGVQAFLNTMPLTADVIPDRPDMNREFCGIQSLIDETPIDVRAENFKDSGNEAYKLAVRMKKDHTDGTAKREAEAKQRQDKGLEHTTLTPAEQKEDDYQVKHLAKLLESHHKRLQDAVVYYSQALDVELDPQQTQNGKLKISKHLKAQIYVNRALVHSTMQNYARCQADCDAALQLEPSNPKACYRGALACLAVQPPKLEKARQYVMQGAVRGPAAEARKKKDWQFRAEQKALDDVEAKIVALEEADKAKVAAKKQAAAFEDANERAYAGSLAQALQSRGLKLGPLVFDFAATPYMAQSREPGKLPRAYLHPAPPAPYSSSTTLSWPLLFLYPDVLQSDFVCSCREEDTLAAHLGAMFPPHADWAPWDDKKQYRLDNLAVYIDARGSAIPADSTPAQDQAHRVLVNPAHSLRTILCNPKLSKKGYAIPGVPTFIVLPRQ